MIMQPETLIYLPSLLPCAARVRRQDEWGDV
jgi:hypothetical protein